MPKAHALQQKLWIGYQQYLHAPSAYTFKSYEGVAAFPSLHVAVAAMFTCFLYRLHPILGWLAAGYTAIIEIGSVTLGWHYAIDGYFSIFLVYLLYRHSLRLIPEKEKGTVRINE
jgi:membrane-associated phospholipid phosphatase